MAKSTFTEAYEKFRSLLVEYRKEADLSQTELAEALERPQSYVSKYERGERRLDVVELIDVCECLSVDPCDVIRQLGE